MTLRARQNLSISRRKFLKRSAAATGATIAAPMIVPRSVFGADAPSNRVNIGGIGAGRQAWHSNLPWFVQSSDCRVVAVCDVDSWRLDNARKAVEKHYADEKASGSYTGCAAYGDFRDLLARDDIDAVMVSTPDHWHVPISIAAAKAGKDVACEKPLSMSINEGRVLAKVVQQNRRVFRVDSEFRSHDYFHRACELVRNGRIGTLHTIRTGAPCGDIACGDEPEMPVPEELDYDLWLGPAPLAPYTEKRVHPRHGYERPGWMRIQDYCHGMITNWGTHLNDVAQWGHGTDRTGPVEVEATGTYPTGGLWNVLLSFEARYKFADGVDMFYVMDQPYVRFEGDEGWIQADYGKGLTASSESILQEEIGPDEIHLRLKHELQDFIDCVKTRGRTLEDEEVGHRTTSLCHLAHISIKLGGEKLRWDPDREEFIDNDAANKLRFRPPMREPWIL
jgi:predicted dehydrogenase